MALSGRKGRGVREDRRRDTGRNIRTGTEAGTATRAGVTLWLKKIYGDMPIPEYEVNERTVDILHEVMEFNEERDKDVTLLIEDMKDRATKYEEAKYWQDILGESLGLSEGSLSLEANKDLTDLVESALDLNVEDTSLTSFYSAINNMTSELYETKSENEELELELNTLTKKLTSALVLEKKLEEDIEKLKESQEAEKAEAEIQLKDLKFLENKSVDLKIRISDAEEKLVAMGMDQSLTHEALMKSSEELAALEKEIEPLKNEVASYHDLPLSIPLARVKVEEARKELQALEEEFTREVQALPFEKT
ncbi:HAUS augmin-like complex subunit 1 isoform X2 [Cyanistes caeruleus]|uniref:HAUS augmin-like complex subunit 1 isoform X2 n=1 Tax=Cyanistes caeruleus TaxID=156563 RepID=UPI000CDB4EF3|nr:HAUS augmin-like complex subunit 1 isoform X2 [Cyanistes caeruleus]